MLCWSYLARRIIQYIDRVKWLMKSKKPTRVLIVGASSLFNFLSRGWLEVPFASSGFPAENSAEKKTMDQAVSLILALNRESMLFDPCDWVQLKSELLKWAEVACPLLQINELTDRLFCERTSVRHSPRIIPYLPRKCTSVYKFYDPEQAAQ